MNTNPFDEIAETLSRIEDFILSIKQQNESVQKKSSTETDQLLTIKETAQFFQVTKATIFAWKKSGKLNPLRMGSRIYFKKSELLSALQSKKTRGQLS